MHNSIPENSFENLRIYILNKSKSITQAFCQSYSEFLISLKKINSFFSSFIRKIFGFLKRKPDQSQEKTYYLQKIPSNNQINRSSWIQKRAFNEEISQKLENLLYQKKLAEFLEIIRGRCDLSEVKPGIFSLLFEILTEISNVTVAFEVMKSLIACNCPHLNKKIIKSFFNICAKLKQMNLAVHLFQFFESQMKNFEYFENSCGEVSSENELKSFEGEEKMNLSLSPISQISGQNKSKYYHEKIEKNSLSSSSYFLMNHYFILGLEKMGDLDTAFKYIETFLANIYCTNENIRIVHKIFEQLLKGCIAKPSISISCAFQILNSLKMLTMKPNDIFFNKLIDFASKNDCVDLAELLFKTMLNLNISPTIVTYNTLIYSYFKHNVAIKAWAIFEQLKNSPIKPDNFTYTTMINGIKSSKDFDLKLAFQLFEEYKKFNKPDQIIYNCLLDACINSCNFEKAREILSEIKQTLPDNCCDEITYNTLIKGCCKSKQLMEAISFFEEMKASKIQPNRITYNSLVDCCVKTNKMNIAWKFYDEMLRNEIIPDNFTYSILINGIKSNNTNKEELIKTINLLEKLGDQFQPDEILYNSLIDACVKFNEINKALCLFEEMKKKNIEPSSITYGILIKAFGKMNDLVKAFKIFEQMKINKLKINDVTYGCLLDACVKNNRIDLALVLFEKIKQDNITLNTILYTTLIKGFSRANKLAEALEIFSTMKINPKTYPNIITYNCILDACVKMQAFDKALTLFEEMKQTIVPDLITYSTLIKGFSKIGDLKVSYDLFTSMVEKNIIPDEPLSNLILEACFVNKNSEMGIKIYEYLHDLNAKFSNISYGIMIKIYGQARKFNQAMNVLNQMKKRNLKPGVIIYTNLLQVCFNMRRIDRAVLLFEKMQQENIQLDHVCYMKLINGALSCGKVELAYSFYEKSVADNISLNSYVYKSLIEEIIRSQIAGKDKIIESLEKTIGRISYNSYAESNHSKKTIRIQKENYKEEKKDNSSFLKENENNNERILKPSKKYLENKTNNNFHNNSSNKENTNNFNFRNKNEEPMKPKVNNNNKFINQQKKSKFPLANITYKDTSSSVGPKNL